MRLKGRKPLLLVLFGALVIVPGLYIYGISCNFGLTPKPDYYSHAENLVSEVRQKLATTPSDEPSFELLRGLYVQVLQEVGHLEPEAFTENFNYWIAFQNETKGYLPGLTPMEKVLALEDILDDLIGASEGRPTIMRDIWGNVLMPPFMVFQNRHTFEDSRVPYSEALFESLIPWALVTSLRMRLITNESGLAEGLTPKRLEEITHLKPLKL